MCRSLDGKYVLTHHHLEQDSTSYNRQKHTPRILAIAGGKGGVGKSITASMLGMCLAGFERKTVLIDADFGGSNLHNYLGLQHVDSGLSDFLYNTSKSLNDFCRETFFRYLQVIPFHSDFTTRITVSNNLKFRFFQELKALPADYIILDLGTASTDLALDMFLAADDKILMSTGELFSIQNTYQFIRRALIHLLGRATFNSIYATELFHTCGQLSDGQLVKPFSAALEHLKKEDPASYAHLDHIFSNFVPKLILKCSEGESLRDVSLLGPVIRDLLNISVSYLGKIHEDHLISSVIRQGRPDMLLNPMGRAASDIVSLVTRHVLAEEAQSRKASMRMEQALLSQPTSPETDEKPICDRQCLVWYCCEKRCTGEPCARLSRRAIKKVKETL